MEITQYRLTVIPRSSLLIVRDSYRFYKFLEILIKLGFNGHDHSLI